MSTHEITRLEWAKEQDAGDSLAGFREEFLIPQHDGKDIAYFCGNSLGLQPRSARAAVTEELDAWAELGVEGHFRAARPWLTFHETLRDGLAEVLGALPSEVVAMNSLTANLHFMMVSFYRPTAERPAILIEKHSFPSDRYAVESQVRFHGFDPADALIELEGDEPNGTISQQAIEQAIEQHGSRIALVMLPGVQYLTGQAFDLAAITKLAHAKGCVVGYDLAHAAGNLALNLHDSDADFAIWCNYKYLNAGPGAIGGAFVHERHARAALPRFAGWWGHDKETRFQMGPHFVPTPGADGWQLSNATVLGLAPLRASLGLFQRAGMPALRKKSETLTGYLEMLIASKVAHVIEVTTPSSASRRGCQLSLRVKGERDAGRALFDYLTAHGVVVDWREPNIIRAAPVPLYNRHADCLQLVNGIEDWSKTQ